MSANAALKILSDVIVFEKYARFLPEQRRRETWPEVVARNEEMHLKKFPLLADEIRAAYRLVLDKKVLPSMRSIQFAGRPIELMPNRINNCCYEAMDHPLAFSEAMFLLLGGSGLGFSVQKHHVAKLPPIRQPSKRRRRHLIGDDIVGWSEAVRVLMASYFDGSSTIEFDFSDIRRKGTILKTSGGRAPGPQPLKDALHNVRKVLDRALERGERGSGVQLRPIECHDIMCYIADAVLAGGIRRSALISLFSIDDEEMMTCKYGTWWELNPQRGRANNSVVVVRHKIKKKQFRELWKKIRASGTGDPGIYWTNNAEIGTNPCAEISLRNNQFCNVTSTNVSDLASEEDFLARVRAATLIGTLQAAYTEFPYLRDVWRETTEKEALIGVSMTGIASGGVFKYDLKKAARLVRSENRRIAKIIGINPAARCTTTKPEGTGSLVVGSSSGIHAWYARYYIRRITINKQENLYTYLANVVPDLLEDDIFKPHLEAKLMIPIAAPPGAVLRTEEIALHLLARIKRVNLEWVRPGHRTGDNTHNVSATVEVRENEWDEVGEWMWDNRRTYNGLTVFPWDGGAYQQKPFTECTEAAYRDLLARAAEIDLSRVKESQDGTSLAGEAACAGGACER